MVFSCFCLSLPNINDIKNLNICFIAMRYPKMSQPEKDVLVVQPTEVPNDVANEVVNVNTPHKRDAATKEKVLKLLKLENVTSTGPDTGPTTPTITSTPEPHGPHTIPNGPR